jgi:hypothetical protein
MLTMNDAAVFIPPYPSKLPPPVVLFDYVRGRKNREGARRE